MLVLEFFFTGERWNLRPIVTSNELGSLGGENPAKCLLPLPDSMVGHCVAFCSIWGEHGDRFFIRFCRRRGSILVAAKGA